MVYYNMHGSKGIQLVDTVQYIKSVPRSANSRQCTGTGGISLLKLAAQLAGLASLNCGTGTVLYGRGQLG